MKKNLIIALMGSVLVFSGCGSQGNKTESGAKSLTSAQRSENAAVKRAELEAQRKIDLASLIMNNLYYENVNGNVVYYKAEMDPYYIGGPVAMSKFLKENLVYPEVAENEGMEGTVFVDFVVSETGEVTETTATSHTYMEGGKLFSAEALRVVNLMPNWIPGSQNGKAVNVKFSVPITFESI